MAVVLDYNGLVDAIQTYTERSDAPFITNIPLFIMLGQQRLAKDLKIVGTKQTITDNLLIGQQQLQKPQNWLNTSTFYVKVVGPNAGVYDTYYPVQHRALEFCRYYWPTPTRVAQPKYFNDDTDYDNFLIFPTPDVAYPYELTVFILPDMIDTTISSNFFTQYCPNALIYACLIEAIPYLKDDERTQLWTQYYMDYVNKINQEDLRRIYDGFSKRGS